MMKKQMSQYLSNLIQQKDNPSIIELFKEEKDYVERNDLLSELSGEPITIVEKDSALRFADAYIERSNKETEELISEEGQPFLSQPIRFLKENMNEFIYIESNWFELIRVESVSFEVDDVFGTYDVMLGLKQPKKLESNIKQILENELDGDQAKFDLMFEDGMWNLNFDLNSVKGFHEEMNMGEAFQTIYVFLFKLVETLENK
ncbi:branched-chain amino acid aminotransferase [Neobacillus sp. D3-1R]|uniref:branched-chain amino acid aminotransferase n=1 Tax=Neobacillus sp. D3-1R TaxID=3445778 RepID=UPI003F9EEDDA